MNANAPATQLTPPLEGQTAAEARENTIAVYLLDESPTNPRRTSDAAADAGLLESVRAHGVIVPLLVRRSPTAPGRFEVIAGSRRLRAAKAAELPNVPVRMIDAKSDDEIRFLQLIENVQRLDIPPFEEAETLFALQTGSGWTASELAQRVGKSLTHVLQRLALLDVVAEARAYFDKGLLPISGCALLAKLPNGQQKQCLKHLFAFSDEPVSVAHVRDTVEARVMRHLKQARFDPTDTHAPGGSCVLCPKRAGNNQDFFGFPIDDDLCLDRKCFDRKSDYAWRAVKAKAAGENLEVLEGTKADHAVRGERGYVRVDRECFDDPKGRKWGKLLGAKDFPRAYARTSDGDVVELLKKGPDLMEALRSKHPAIAKIKAQEKEAKAGKSQGGLRKELAEWKAYLAALAGELSIASSLKVIETAQVPRAVLDAWLELQLERAPYDTAQRISERRGLTTDGDRLAYPRTLRAETKRVLEGDEPVVVGMITEVLVTEVTSYFSRTVPDAVRKLAEAVGVDLKAVRKRVKRKLAPKKKASKAAKPKRER